MAPVQPRYSKWRIAFTLLLAFKVLCFTSPAVRVLADHAEVTVTGSAGTVDDQDLAEYEVRNQFATIKSSVASGTVVYRYQLPATNNFEDGCGCTYNTRIRYRDTGPNQTIIVRLRAALLTGDGVETIYTFNSNTGDGTDPAPPNMNANQTFDGGFTAPGDHIVHGRYGYFLEVEVTKNSNDGTQDPGFIGFALSDAGISS